MKEWGKTIEASGDENKLCNPRGIQENTLLYKVRICPAILVLKYRFGGN